MRGAVGFDFAQHRHHLAGVIFDVLAGGVHYVHEQGGIAHFFQRGAKRLHQRGGQMADEAHRIAHNHLPARGQLQLAHRGIERGKEARVGHDARAGEPVEERRFAGVGVAHHRERGQRHFKALAPLRGAARLHGVQFLRELLDAVGDFAAVGFELGFAGAAGADAAAEPRHLNAFAGKPRQQVIELRQFHLELSFTGAGSRGEDVEDDLGAVHYAHVERFFEVAQLRRRKLLIEDDEVGFKAFHHAGEFGYFAGTDERGGVEGGAVLDEPVDDLGTGGGGE